METKIFWTAGPCPATTKATNPRRWTSSSCKDTSMQRCELGAGRVMGALPTNNKLNCLITHYQRIRIINRQRGRNRKRGVRGSFFWFVEDHQHFYRILPEPYLSPFLKQIQRSDLFPIPFRWNHFDFFLPYDYFPCPSSQLSIWTITRFFCKEIISCPGMSSQKRLPSPKEQKFTRTDTCKQDFFDMLMDTIKHSLTPQEHEFLMNFILHNRNREKAVQVDHAARVPRPSLPSKHDESPLHHLRQDVFAEPKRTPKRMTTLTEVLNMSQQPSSTPPTTTARKKASDGKGLLRTIFTRQENRAPSSPIKISRKESAKDRHFKIYQIRKNKFLDCKPSQILKDKKMVQTYDGSFLKDIFGDDSFVWPQELNERYTFNAPQQHQTVNIYANLKSRQQAEQEKYRTINSLQFDRSLPRKRTAIKLHCRKY